MNALATPQRVNDLDGSEKKERARLAKAMEQAPYDGELPMALGDLEMKEGRFDAALLAYELAARLLPKASRVHSRRAMACHQAGHSNDAARYAVLATTLDPDDVPALKVLARIHLDTWQHEAAQKACRRILKRNEFDGEARQMLDEALVQEAKLAANLVEPSLLPSPVRPLGARAKTARPPRASAPK